MMRMPLFRTRCASPLVMGVLCCAVGLLSACDAGDGAPANAPRPHGRSLADAQVVTHADGVGYAVWIQEAGWCGRSGVFSSRQRNGVWDVPQQIHASTTALSEASDLRWVVHPGGEATLVWLQASQGGVRRVFHSHTVNGVWRAGEPIRPAGSDAEARGVQIATDGRGSVFAVWSESMAGEPGGRSIWASRFSGGGFGPPAKLNAGHEPADAPRITVTGAHHAFVVWDRDEGRHRRLFSSTYWNGAWTPSQLVDSDTASSMWGELWDLVIARNF